MLLYPYKLYQCRFAATFRNGNRRLQYDGSGIHSTVHEMYGAAAYLHSSFQGLSLRMQSRKGRQKGRMQVHNSVFKSLNNRFRQYSHETGAYD